MRLRQPIIAVLGHVDSGKTTLLDAIRNTSVAKQEAGAITQHIGASEIPVDNIKRLCGKLIRLMNIKIEIPGLLFIDTPGHEAFSTLRRRGGSIADIAILVVDINAGLEAQTIESLIFLKEFKTPFIVAATKIDKLPGFLPSDDYCFLPHIKDQKERFINMLEEKTYKIVAELYEQGFNADRYDRIDDFTKRVAIVPVSSITKTGIADLLVLITGLSQRYLKERIRITSCLLYTSPSPRD